MSSLRTNTSLQQIADLLSGHRSFVVCSHVRPDGDALGSSLAAALALRALGKDVRVLNEDGLPDNLSFLPGSDLVERPSSPVSAEVILALDTAAHARLGENVLRSLPVRATLVNIDHHVSNPGYGDLHFIDGDSPATGQVIHDLIRTAGIPLDRSIAENLYTAISTDTGSFQYSSTTSRTYRIAADLVDCGIEVGDLNRRIYQSYPLRRVRLLGQLLSVLEISAAGRCASWHLTRDMAASVGALPEDTEHLIDHLRAIEGVIIAAFFEEMPDGKVRLSLRSKDPRVDASALCARFGGGGHKMAAGARLPGPLWEARTQVLHAIHEALAAI